MTSSSITRRQMVREKQESARMCAHCGRTFKRTEHLERHVRTRKISIESSPISPCLTRVTIKIQKRSPSHVPVERVLRDAIYSRDTKRWRDTNALALSATISHLLLKPRQHKLHSLLLLRGTRTSPPRDHCQGSAMTCTPILNQT